MAAKNIPSNIAYNGDKNPAHVGRKLIATAAINPIIAVTVAVTGVAYPITQVTNAEIVTSILMHNGFEVATKGGNDDGRYYLTAYKRGDEFKG
jgi:hypothetical protein